MVWMARPLQVSLVNHKVEYNLIAQEVESAEYRGRVSSTYTTRTRTRGVVLHMLGGQEACTEGAMIHKAAVRRCGHKGGTQGCTSAGTDARVSSTVTARVGHVIDRGKAHSPQGILS